jgi:hypothetical protein
VLAIAENNQALLTGEGLRGIARRIAAQNAALRQKVEY